MAAMSGVAAALMVATSGPASAASTPSSPAEIRAAYHQAFTGGEKLSYALAAVEDGPSLRATVLAAKKNFPQAVETSRVKVQRVNVSSAKHAKTVFTLTYQGGAEFGAQNGTAVFVGGQWKVSRATFCAVMSLAGATCPPRK